jgi:hypothetical protein
LDPTTNAQIDRHRDGWLAIHNGVLAEKDQFARSGCRDHALLDML